MNQNNEKQKGLVISNLQDGAFFYHKGIEAYRDKNLIKAKRYLERAVKLEPKEPAFLCQLAIVHADLGDLQRSNDCLTKIIDHNLGDEMPECYFFLANNYANLGLFEHARKEALQYIEKDPDGEFLEDIEDLLELLQEEDDLFAETETLLIRYELATHELKKKNFERAILLFSELIKENPMYWMAHIRQAEAYFLNGNQTKAIEILQAVLKQEDNLLARAYLMTYFYETGEIEKVEKLVQCLTNVVSFDLEHSYILAVSFGKVGEHELAYSRLEKLYRKGFGDSPKFNYHLAVAAFYTGRINKAIALWEKLAKSGYNEAMANLHSLQENEEMTPTYHYTGLRVD